MLLRANATGTIASILRPMMPSANKSTARPEKKAMNSAPVVPILVGMQSIIAGRIDSKIY